MDIASFNWVDYSILGILGFSVLISLARGFIREAISLATWIIALWVAYKYGHDFGQSVLTMITSDQARSLVGAGILFFGILIVGSLVNFAIGQVVSSTGLSAIDRILGMAFGFIRGVLLIAILMLVGEIMQFNKKTWWTESQLIPQFSALSEWLKGFVPEQFEKLKQKEELHSTPPASPATVPEQSTVETTVLPQAVDMPKQHVESIVTQEGPAQAPQAQPVTPAPATVVPATPAPAMAPAPSTTTTTTTTVQPPAVEDNTAAPAPTTNQTY